MSGDSSSQLAIIQDALLRMEGQLSTVCTDVENLKRTRPQEQGAQLPGEQQVPGMA